MSRGKNKRNRSSGPTGDSFHDMVDPNARDFIYDEVDEYYEKQEREGLKNLNRLLKKNTKNTRNEILAIASSSEDEDTPVQARKKKNKKKSSFAEAEPLPALDSDLEEGDKVDDDEDAITKDWGKKRSMYYNADYVDEDWNDADASDAEVAEREEEEALAIQERLAQQLQDDDFGLEFITQLKEAEKPKQVEKKEEKVSLELASLSKREKLELLSKESPELLDLIEDFKVQLSELKNRLEPLVKLIDENVLPQTPGTDYILTKYRLIINYCIQISYYFQLKSKRISVQNHSVIKRLVQFRGLLHQLNLGGSALETEMDDLLQKLKKKQTVKREDFEPSPAVTEPPRKKLSILRKLKEKDEKKEPEKEETIPKKKLEKKREEEELTRDEQSAVELYEAISSRKKPKKPAKPVEENSEESADEEAAEDVEPEAEGTDTEKRAINYQIAKNKGLTPHRSKEQRNPRVKHRNKFRKAKIRRKGQVRESRKELKRYDGEISGIKTTTVRSIKIK